MQTRMHLYWYEHKSYTYITHQYEIHIKPQSNLISCLLFEPAYTLLLGLTIYSLMSSYYYSPNLNGIVLSCVNFLIIIKNNITHSIHSVNISFPYVHYLIN